jgi:two-component sensor histidine kinase
MSETVHILYIDDDPGLGRLMQKSLAREGVSVTHVTSGAAGLAHLADGRFDIIALDHNLGPETGLDLIPHIRAIELAPPIIYVTGSEDARIAVAAMKAGAVDYVWKDVAGHYRDLLGQAIASALSQEKLKREREDAQRQIAEAKERAELLLAEVHHRVSNSLALVASLAAMQAGAVADPSARIALHEMQARILAIANIHRRLYTSQDVRFVDLDAYMHSLGEEIDAAMNTGGPRHTIVVSAEPDISLPTDMAISLGVVLTELVTNAVKYAYPADRPGEVRLGLRRLDGGRIEIRVEDDGVGWQGTGAPQGTGLGSRIIAAIGKSLNARLTYDPAHRGTRAIFELDYTPRP